MAAKLIDISQARAAKDAAKQTLRGVAGICGFGITRKGKQYAVRVNLEQSLDVTKLPEEIERVSVVYHVSGKIRKQ